MKKFSFFYFCLISLLCINVFALRAEAFDINKYSDYTSPPTFSMPPPICPIEQCPPPAPAKLPKEMQTCVSASDCRTVRGFIASCIDPNSCRNGVTPFGVCAYSNTSLPGHVGSGPTVCDAVHPCPQGESCVYVQGSADNGLCYAFTGDQPSVKGQPNVSEWCMMYPRIEPVPFPQLYCLVANDPKQLMAFFTEYLQSIKKCDRKEACLASVRKAFLEGVKDLVLKDLHCSRMVRMGNPYIQNYYM